VTVGFKDIKTKKQNTLCDQNAKIVLMDFPEPVIGCRSLKLRRAADKMGIVSGKLVGEDPPAKVHRPETGQTILRGMGELLRKLSWIV